MRECLTAYTHGNVTYPSYCSINIDGEVVEISVRGPPTGMKCGLDVTMKMDLLEFESFLKELNGRYARLLRDAGALHNG